MHTEKQFTWIGINEQGKKITGKIISYDQQTAISCLQKKNIILLCIKKDIFIFFLKRKISEKQKLDIMQQLQLLLQSSVPLSDSLSIIATTTKNTTIQSLLNKINETIISGASFSDSLRQFPLDFDDTFCHIISAGEQSGQLDVVLTQLINNIEQRIELRNKMTKALFYPLCVVAVALLISAGLLIFVIPQFSAIYNNFGAQLPMLTKSLIALSDYIRKNCFFILFGFIVFIYTFKHSYIKNSLHYIIYHLPFIKSLMITKQITQWCQLLSMTLSSGIPMVDALHIANLTLSHLILKNEMQEVKKAVIHGKSLYAALDLCHHFPVRAKTMIAIGENADALPYMMEKITYLYQQQLTNTLDRLSKLLEPVIMMLVASMVSGLIIAMYLPIFKMGSVI